MTITYTGEVATCTGLGCFWRLLFRWKGSIYKLLWPNFFLYGAVYFALSCVYRFVLSEENRRLFEKICLHCQTYADLIPIAFILGFYVSIVIKRWWDQYMCMPWPDNLAMFVSTLIPGQDDRGRLMRRTVIRYVNLSLVITLRMMSPRVKKRFPTMDHLVEAGFMQPNEKKVFDALDQKTSHPKYWMPLVWAGSIITRARKEGRIKDDFSMKTLIDELNTFRGGCGGMLNYDWISIPLVYTQVVTLAVYAYFIATLMSNQFLDPSMKYPKHEIDLVFPTFTFLQFSFYMGWLKVAESLVNPFGEDDDDFELNWLVDRNLQVSYVIVDEMHQEHPEMVKDQYWDEVFPAELPYTAAAKQYQTGPPPHSAENVEVSLDQAEFMPLETVVEEPQDERDEMGDMELDGDIQGDSGSRTETQPVKMTRMIRLKSGSAGSISSSFSGPRTSRKNSVLNMLTKLFRRNESSRDIGSNMGSSASIQSRRGPRSNSRMSYLSQSQGQSRTSIFRENTFPDEMFRMSDISLAGSTNTIGSAIQMVAPKEHAPKSHQGAGEGVEEDHESTEASQLIPPRKNNLGQRKISRNLSAEIKAVDLSVADDGSDASCSSGKITFYPDCNSNAHLAVSDTYPSPSSSKVTEIFKRGLRSVKEDWRDSVTSSPSVTITEPAAAGEQQSMTTRVIIPNSPPKRQTFLPISTYSSAVKDIKRKISDPKSDIPRQQLASSLTRSLQQQLFEGSPRTVPHPKPEPDQLAETHISISESPCTELNIYEPNIKPEHEPVVAILPPVSHFTSTTATATVVPSDMVLTTSVSLPSATVTTTSTITTSAGSTQPVTTFVSSPIASAQRDATIINIQPRSETDTISEFEEKISNILASQQLPFQTSASEEVPSQETTMPEESPPPPQYIPSAAIPVPSVSPARAASATDMLESDFELIEAALMPMQRRTHHDYHNLEPISEHGEVSSDSPVTSAIESDGTSEAANLEREGLPT
ncbi:uncharacterized protein LOC124613197 isoform X1 [Schistocerca americana]|uniref:uncharacterized protein LOC124613197 isoform X1 n=1 Tax=Schistocerca americana TaxID=7009 RepID=UPI001F4FE67E|nr:uncharacterized protein LOC124613197 isoform X1 [Schistocerca americana]XP_047115219.1 uncharacterized protein LOC124795301 isoform X1 [Schistocerca piceifrons]XP_047115220.1 uncharacterized protein LOC124795301 isoform X1 [Schistocerca piceifrons]